MATRVEEAFTEREQKVNAKGEVIEIEIPYIVFEAENEDAALSAARTKAAGVSVKDMELDEVEVSERVNKDTWKVKAIWKSDSEEEDDDEFEDEAEDEEDYGDEYDFGDEVIYEVKCPACGEIVNIDEEMLDEGSTVCPNCGEELEFDLEDEEPEE